MNESDKPLFDRYANSYSALHASSIKASGEEPTYFAAFKAKYMASHVRPRGVLREPMILDFGCGIGNSMPHLHIAFPQAALHGADLSAESIALAQAAHGELAEFAMIVEERLPYADASFDLIMVACVYHHIPPAKREYWTAELRRVLKPGGSLYVFEHNLLNPLTRKAVNECPFDEDAILLPRRELLDLAHNAGFHGVGSRYIVFFPHFLATLRPLEPLLGWLPLGAQYVVYASA